MNDKKNDKPSETDSGSCQVEPLVMPCFVSFAHKLGFGFRTMNGNCTTRAGIKDIYERLEKDFGDEVVIITLKELTA